MRQARPLDHPMLCILATQSINIHVFYQSCGVCCEAISTEYC